MLFYITVYKVITLSIVESEADRFASDLIEKFSIDEFGVVCEFFMNGNRI